MIAAPVDARDPHYGAVTDAAVNRCDDLHWRGKNSEANICYQELLDGDDAPSAKAEAAWALGDIQLANEYFRLALSSNADDAAALVRWGDLFAASHQDAEAMNIYRDALNLDAENSYANLGAGRVLASSFEEAANDYLQTILTNRSGDDGATAGALMLAASISLENGNIDSAQDSIDAAQTIIEHSGWPPLEVYALRAAVDLVQGVAVSEWTQKSLDYNPNYGGIYSIPAHFLVITRRYRDAIDLYQKAVNVDPGLAAAHESLGINLLRDNQISRARQHLETAYEEDPFSPRAVNTLRLLDSLTNFRVIDDPAVTSDVPMVLRLHKDEADVIAPYAIALIADSIAEFSARYDFKLKEPVVVEMYPDHEDFAVRTAGMPGLGILGATFGYVVAMDSPSGRPASQFQWGTTLWHEMAHVFTLEATDHLVPRWFSEGVSVYEEWRSGPNAGVRIPLSVLQAMHDDRFLPVAELDEGFIRPSYEEQVIVSYMQAGLICRFIEQSFGAEKLVLMLTAYRDGLLTPEAIEFALSISAAEFDIVFFASVAEEYEQLLGNLEEWHDERQTLAQKSSAEQWSKVAVSATELIALMPEYVETDSPYLALARAQTELGLQADATQTLRSFWTRGGYAPAALIQLGQWLYEDGKTDAAIEVLQGVNLVDPLNQEIHGMLGDMLLEADRASDALREFEVALALRPHDLATAWYRIAQAHAALGQTSAAQSDLLQALDVAPGFRPAQRLLLQLADGDSPRS
jgi:tetratricopeptide (TPR) repeat protein